MTKKVLMGQHMIDKGGGLLFFQAIILSRYK